jgi:hypothetical protein
MEWVARNHGVTFVDPNSWIRNCDFSRDGLCECQKAKINWLDSMGNEFSEERPEGFRITANTRINNSTRGLGRQNADKAMMNNADKKRQAKERIPNQLTGVQERGQVAFFLLQVNCRSIYNTA